MSPLERADAEDNLADILSNANRDRSGHPVFKDADGNLRDEEGQFVDPLDVDMTEWDNEGPTWEAYDHGLQDVQRLTEFYERVVDTGSRLDAGDLSADDLSALGDDLDALEEELTALKDAPSDTVDHAGNAFEDMRPEEQPAIVDGFTPVTPVR